MTQAKTWKLLTLLSPPPPDRPGAVMISNPLLKERVLVDRDVLMDLLADSFPADSDRSTGDPALAKARVGSSSGLLPLVSLEQLRRHRPGSRDSPASDPQVS